MFKDQKENNSSRHIKLYCLCSETLSVWDKLFFNPFSPVIVSHLKWKKNPIIFLRNISMKNIQIKICTKSSSRISKKFWFE